jgi:hypothetical protein
MPAGPRGLVPATPTLPTVACAVQAVPTPTPERRTVATRPGQSEEEQVRATIMADAPRATVAPPDRDVEYCAPPVAGLLSLDEAAARVRAFLGQPDARFSAKYVPVSYGYGGTTPAYYIVSLRELRADGTIAADVFNVDTRSGLVDSASFSGWATAPALTQPLDSEAARVRAEDYARAHFPDFGTLTFAGISTQRGVPQNGIDEEFLVAQWDFHDPGSGAVLPTSVQVRVSPRSGQIVGYSARQDDYRGPTVPQITREEAEARAREAQLARGFRDVPASGSALYGLMPYSLNANQAAPVLVWAVQFPGYVPVYVDALIGEVIVEGPKG